MDAKVEALSMTSLFLAATCTGRETACCMGGRCYKAGRMTWAPMCQRHGYSGAASSPCLQFYMFEGHAFLCNSIPTRQNLGDVYTCRFCAVCFTSDREPGKEKRWFVTHSIPQASERLH
ncbi:unnamed protein product [Eretmochelys imbricata]